MASSSSVLLSKVVAKVAIVVVGLSIITCGETLESATWCVSRSEASDVALQTAMDYACGAGADCTPIQSSGLCFLPNTVQAHASYAFNSFYQRKAQAPGACDFSGTATVARTDPSYGSCDYPSSLSTAGGSPTTPTTTPTVNAPPTPGGATTPLYGTGGLTPGFGPVIPDGNNSSKASPGRLVTAIFVPVSLFLVLSFIC
ncbi:PLASMODESMATA CALLOSE-BINDING PROTEIN 3-like [Cornus florida]|uniref:PLASMODESMATA CALLOSE-BINDING PROTEIN 3-like n=1 Tax=Cornus florida TaxID=4283 RepID=UPI002896D637|nr:PLASMODESMATA CALLOSE-BINDING PROTEIN 3-like [Cornus florida]